MPDLSDLDAAMMQPALSVPAVRRLGGGTIRLNESARPLRADGRDAVVYELRTPNGRILALRCLLRSDPHRDLLLAEHYAGLRFDRALEGLRLPGGPLPRDLLWVPEGIALPGPDLQRVTIPLIAMERVPGRTMALTVDRLCREEQTDPLALLADGWLETIAALDEVGFSHGDLAADNLMVRPDGSIAVIDLDTASWPSAVVAAPASKGTPGYAHPRGAPTDRTQRDRFPALIIWASLRILTRHPSLRARWGDHPDRHGAALLWSEQDLRRPERSPLFDALNALDDRTLRPLLDIVQRAIHYQPEETPPLAEIAARLDGLGFPRLASTPEQVRRRRWAPPVATAPETHPIFGETEEPWDEDAAAVHLAHGPRSGRHPDASHTTTLAERERRLAAVQQLAAAVAAGDTALATRLWTESRAIPEAATYAPAMDSLLSHEKTTAIERAMRRGDDSGLVAAVAEAEHAGVAPSHAARSALRAAQERIAARSELREAIDRGNYGDIAALKRCGKLECLGRLEPTQARAVARSLAWPALERALNGDDDVAIAAVADPELWREEGALSPEAWRRIVLARRRLRWADDVRAALRRRDGAVLRGLLADAPPEVEERLTEVESRRILRVTVREAAVVRLERALRNGPDREVVAALAEFESAGAPFSDVLDWTAVRGVVDRISLAEALREAVATDPPDTAMLARLLPAARAALDQGVDSGGPDWVELERSVLRAAHLARLREAITADDDARIAAAANPDPYGATGLLNEDERSRLDRALARSIRRGA